MAWLWCSRRSSSERRISRERDRCQAERDRSEGSDSGGSSSRLKTTSRSRDLQLRDRAGAPREENLHTNTAKNRVPGGSGGVDGGARLQAGALLSERHAAARSSRAASLAALAGDAGDSDGNARIDSCTLHHANAT